MKRIYVDYNATTPVRPEVFEEMKPYFVSRFGNPSSVHSFGQDVAKEINVARESVANLIGADSKEIYFTGCGTESDNLALKGIAFANRDKGDHIITSKIEHRAVLDSGHFLEKAGFRVSYLPVDQDGLISPDVLKNAMTPDTILVSIMHSNNEIGTIEPIKELAKIVKEMGAYFHTDAVQSVGKVPLDVRDLQVDLLSISAHKFYGPKGVGAIFIKKGTKIEPFMHGGHQERRKRAGTLNVPGIVGLGKAAELAKAEISEEQARLVKMRDKLIDGLQSQVKGIRLNGHRTKRLPNNVSFCFEKVEGESILLMLDMEGIAASSGSACTSDTLEPSHVILAIGVPAELAHGSVRFSIGILTVEEDIDYILEKTPPIIERLRTLSPLK